MATIYDQAKGLARTVEQERGARGDFFLAEDDDSELWGHVTLPWVLAQLSKDREPDADGIIWQDVNRRFYDGDHWQEGDGWIGPRPKPGNEQVAMPEIKRGFVSSNQIKAGTRRHMNAAVGREPTWTVTLVRPLGVTVDAETGEEVEEEPSEQEAAVIGEVDNLLTMFWNERKLHEVLKEATITLLLEKRTDVRYYIPRGKVRRNALGELIIPPGPVEEQLERIFADHPSPQDAMVFRDEDEQADISLYVFDWDNEQIAEVAFIDPNTGETVIRWLGDALTADGTPQTNLDGDREDILGEVRFNLGGRLPIFELKRDPLITPQVVSLQKLLNLALSMMPRNVNLAGFLERIILNGEVPGHWEPHKDDPNRRWVQDTFMIGPGTVNFIAGMEYEQDDGSTSVANPSVVYKDPIEIGPLRDTKDQAKLSMLEEIDQLHTEIAGDATASGESRRQAMAAFIVSVRETMDKVNDLGRWLLEFPIALAEALAGTPGKYLKEVRVEFTGILDPGPIPADEQRLAMEAYDKALLSYMTTAGRIGVEDPVAEKAQIDQEKDANMRRAAELMGGAEGEGNLFGDDDTGEGGPGAPGAAEGA